MIVSSDDLFNMGYALPSVGSYGKFLVCRHQRDSYEVPDRSVLEEFPFELGDKWISYRIDCFKIEEVKKYANKVDRNYWS